MIFNGGIDTLKIKLQHPKYFIFLALIFNTNDNIPICTYHKPGILNNYIRIFNGIL